MGLTVANRVVCTPRLARAGQAIAWQTQVPGCVSTESTIPVGWLTLLGETDWETLN